MSEFNGDPNREPRDGTVEVVSVEHDWSSTRPSIAVVEALAAAEGVDPVEFSRTDGAAPNESVDLDALDTLVADERDSVPTVSFDVGAYMVRIEDGGLAVYAPDDGG